MIAGLLDRMKGLKSFPRGIHPPHRKKFAEAAPIRLFEPSQDLLLPFVQHIGVACDPIVQPRQAVAHAEKIADASSPPQPPPQLPPQPQPPVAFTVRVFFLRTWGLRL